MGTRRDARPAHPLRTDALAGDRGRGTAWRPRCVRNRLRRLVLPFVSELRTGLRSPGGGAAGRRCACETCAGATREPRQSWRGQMGARESVERGRRARRRWVDSRVSSDATPWTMRASDVDELQGLVRVCMHSLGAKQLARARERSSSSSLGARRWRRGWRRSLAQHSRAALAVQRQSEQAPCTAHLPGHGAPPARLRPAEGRHGLVLIAELARLASNPLGQRAQPGSQHSLASRARPPSPAAPRLDVAHPPCADLASTSRPRDRRRRRRPAARGPAKAGQGQAWQEAHRRAARQHQGCVVLPPCVSPSPSSRSPRP